VIAAIFFLATLIGTWSYDAGLGDHVITSLFVNGSADPFLPFPQITVCPLEDGGIIQSIQCREGHKGINGTRVKGPLATTPVYAGSKKDHPQWSCFTMNGNQTIPNGSDSGFVHCDLNSTTTGTFNNKTYTWAGRVIVWVHEPTKDPRHCSECIDGANGVLVATNNTGFIGFQALIYDFFGSWSVEYKTWPNLFFKTPNFAAMGIETSDMDFDLFYFTDDVILYKEPYALAAAIGGERFGKFIVLVGCAGVMAWALWWFIKTFLILLLLGKDALPSTGTAGERDPLFN
jgi:hypothetical protein